MLTLISRLVIQTQVGGMRSVNATAVPCRSPQTFPNFFSDYFRIAMDLDDPSVADKDGSGCTIIMGKVESSCAIQ